jgi:hypothetical protein
MNDAATATRISSESLPGPRWLLRSAVAAFQPNRLVLGTFLALVLGAVGSLADRLHDSAGLRQVSAVEVIRGLRGDGSFVTDRAFADVAGGPCAALAAAETMALRNLAEGILGLEPRKAIDAIGDAVLRAPAAAFEAAPWTMGLVAVVWLAISGLVGGALSLATALEAGRSIRIGARDALAAVLPRWRSLMLAPILPLVGAGICLVPVAILGLGFRVPVLDLIAAAVYPVALFLGFLAVFLLVAGAACLPLMPAAIACGDADAVDAFVRNAAYLVRSPFLWLGSMAVSLVSLAIGLAVASTLGSLVLGLTGLVTTWAGGGWPGEGDPSAVGSILRLWEGLVRAIVAGWIVSFAFEAATRVYLTLRFRCDGQDPSTLDGVTLSAARP